ncbi:hypothetical protein CDD81_6077 [Ophiocordyceps australis]|uniref:Uncharacterized protein n=1 Tax=Ophiocordyceps australis TaxID=1399860 RepID=A0A2C5Y6P2_9HYPO|nr:hypothetical protein CDD81_6077 [Ophiocordyceps australis]
MALLSCLHLLLWAGTCGAAPQKPGPHLARIQQTGHSSSNFQGASHEQHGSLQNRPPISPKGAYKPIQHHTQTGAPKQSSKHHPPPIPPKPINKPPSHKNNHEPSSQHHPPPILPKPANKPSSHKTEHEASRHHPPAIVSPSQQRKAGMGTGFYEHEGMLFGPSGKALPNSKQALGSQDVNGQWYKKHEKTRQWHAWKLDKNGKEVMRKNPLSVSEKAKQQQTPSPEQKAVIKLLETAPHVSSLQQTANKAAGKEAKKDAVVLSAKPKQEASLANKRVVRFRKDFYLWEVDANGKVSAKLVDKEELSFPGDQGVVVRFFPDDKTGGFGENLGRVIDLNPQLMVENDIYGKTF